MEPAEAATELIALQGVRKSYNLGLPGQTEVLHGIDLRLQRGEFVALMGPSGSGKSTLLNILGLLEPMTAGSYRLQGEEMNGMDDTGRACASGTYVLRLQAGAETVSRTVTLVR